MDPLWASLINSDWHDHRGSGAREDRIGNDAWLGGFLARAGWDGRDLPGSGERERLRRMRTLLRRIVDALLARRAVADEDLAALNEVLAGAPVLRRLAGAEAGLSVSLVAAARGMARVMGEVAGSLASMLAEGDPTRLKVCANPDCGWVVYDESRSRTRRWCDATECGNLIKVRSFRRRQRAAGGSPSG